MISKLLAGIAQASMLTDRPVSLGDIEAAPPLVRDEVAEAIGRRMIEMWYERVDDDSSEYSFPEGRYIISISLKQGWECTCKDHEKRGSSRPCGHWLSRIAGYLNSPGMWEKEKAA